METTHSCHIYISGMTCSQCQKRIANALKESNGINQIKVSYKNSDASFVYDSTKIAYRDIVKIINDLGYDVSQQNLKVSAKRVITSVAVISVLFILLQHFNLLNLLAPSKLADSGMGYGTLFVVGLLTSVHCIAMCGGVNLSQSLPASERKKVYYSSAVFYNAGRVISYTLIGLILGTVGYFIGGGSNVGVPLIIQSIFKIIAGILLVIMGLKMLGIFPKLQKLSFHLPKNLTKAVGKKVEKSKTPLIVGLLNGLMPCGPLQSMWLVALSSGSSVKGALSMLLFSLGTVPLMLGFGTFVTVLGKKFTSAVQSVGAVIVSVMGLAMLSQGSSVSGMIPDFILYTFLTEAALLSVCFSIPFKNNTLKYGVSFCAVFLAAVSSVLMKNNIFLNTNENTAKIVNETQIVSSTLKRGSYPEITVQSGIPVKWTIKANADSINGCNRSMISNDFKLNYTFHEGENLIEFTPEKAGDYTYTCWMGMIRGTIHVIDKA